MKIFLTKNALPIFMDFKPKILPLSSLNRWFFDKKAVKKQIEKWTTALPWIKPYYAMKCNPSPDILHTMADSRISLDAASLHEVKMALCYTEPDNIIYTNPHIIPHEHQKIKHILCENKILKVVDSMCEIEKLVKYNIKVPILVRLNSNIVSANVTFDSKFGATIDEAFKIIAFAEKNDFVVMGVSFHIGSGGEFSRRVAYKLAIAYCYPVLEYLETSSYFAYRKEYPILDVGGGMLYDTDLEDALGWTKKSRYKLIAELGRYFSEPAFHMAVQVIAKTERGLYLDNGIYHELNGYHRDHWNFPEITHVYDVELKTVENIDNENNIITKIFGPTCDSYDVIPDCTIPCTIEVGDWIFMSNMGAYTSAGKVDFNGIKGASS